MNQESIRGSQDKKGLPVKDSLESGRPSNEKRDFWQRQREISQLRGMIHLDGQMAPLQIVNERNGGVGIVVSEKTKNKLNFEVEKKVTIETMVEGTRVRFEAIIKHISEKQVVRNKKKYLIGLKYVSGDKLTLRGHGWSTSV